MPAPVRPELPSPAVIAAPGDHGFPHHRIPAMALLPDHTLLLSWDGRPDDGDTPAPNSLLQRRSTDLGRTWGAVEYIRRGHPEAPVAGFSDPSYVVDQTTGTVFNFHVASHDTGFWDAAPGVDDADRTVHSHEVSVSHDGGRTWHHRLVTAQVKPAHFHGSFAASGAGIQITRGPHAGRLVQQMVGRRRARPEEEIDCGWVVSAWSAYSDDHGATWQHGAPVGTALDENKVVELAADLDGTAGVLMMNARDHHARGHRWVCLSRDGGETWSDPVEQPTLVDPGCNGHITRDWVTGTGDDLLFSNAADSHERRNGTLRRSRDGGRTWSDGLVFNPGSTLYSVVLALPDAHAGVFWDSAGVLYFQRIPLEMIP